ncbi:MAG TPA: hypothetical protein PKY96_01540 [Flavobacteriales bacterium]|nr:hypothetical protein [Flavobacteriales bacterium]
MRILLLTHFLLAGWAVIAQPGESLTPEFAGMSSKERARVAKLEQEDAAKDAAFQAVMAEAEALFQGQRFDEALAKFQQARSMRPLNVFPKVKIQDLQALIAKRKAEEAMAEKQPAQLEPKVETLLENVSQVSQPAPEPVREHDAPNPGAERTEPVVERAEPIRIAQPRPTVQSPQPSGNNQPPAEPLPDGIQERTFVEGRAVVLERRIVRDGLATVCRKVTHPWGQVVHFRDGIAISEREWTEMFRD